MKDIALLKSVAFGGAIVALLGSFISKSGATKVCFDRLIII